MSKHNRFLTALCWLCLVWLCSGPAQADGTLIEGGSGIGPYRMGTSFAAVKTALGPPTKVLQSDEASETHIYVYRPRQLSISVKGDTINGITVWSPDYRTADGLRIGSTRQQVEQFYGRSQALRQNQVTYPERGLGFEYDPQDRVVTIYVMDKEARDALSGDLSIRAGQRIGGVQLGLPLRTIAESWGRPDKTAQQQNGTYLMLYQSKGFLLLTRSDQVDGVTTVSPEFGTPDGLRVGSLQAEVNRVYGAHGELLNGQETYRHAGIAFTIDKGKVTEIYVFRPSK